MSNLSKLIIDADICKGCGLCVNICPKKVLALDEALNQKGYHPARLTNNDGCISCAMCGMICPDVAIVVRKEEKA